MEVTFLMHYQAELTKMLLLLWAPELLSSQNLRALHTHTRVAAVFTDYVLTSMEFMDLHGNIISGKF